MPETRQRPATTGRRPIVAGGGIEPHWHDRNQIVYAGRGVLSVTTDAGTWVAPATRAIWIPAGTLHQHRAYGETTLHTVGLIENPLALTTPSALVVSPLLRELILTYTSDEEAVAAASGGGTRRGGASTDGDAAGRRGAAGDGEGPGPREGAGRRDAAGPGEGGGPGQGAEGLETGERERLRRVLLDQLRRSAQRPTYLPAPRDARLVAVCGMVRADPADGRTLAEFGREAGASERTLSRLCRAELGMSFPQWRTQLRLHEALALLADGESVTRVAHATGWASTSAFIDTFKSAFGHTPGSRRA